PDASPRWLCVNSSLIASVHLLCCHSLLPSSFSGSRILPLLFSLFLSISLYLHLSFSPSLSLSISLYLHLSFSLYLSIFVFSHLIFLFLSSILSSRSFFAVLSLLGF